MRRWTVQALGLLALAGAAGAQEPPKSTMVFGAVRNVSGVPVPGAEVWVDGTSLRVVSNDSGEFRIENAPSGRQRLMVRRVGFKPDFKKVSLSPGDAREVKFALEGMLEELDAVVVTAKAGANGRMAEFWARRMVGVGVFITRAEIERRHPPRAADLFAGVMGVRVISNTSNGEATKLVTGRQAMSATRVSNSAASNACPMAFYVDGLYMSGGTFTIDEVSPVQIEAIEIFRGPSEIPARFRQRETGCGLVVIWTREPPAKSKPDKEGTN